VQRLHNTGEDDGGLCRYRFCEFVMVYFKVLSQIQRLRKPVEDLSWGSWYPGWDL